jgi:ATP-binding cassette subfamily F protein uup
MVFEGDGVVNEYIGGYADWFALSQQAKRVEAVRVAEEAGKKAKPKSGPSKKLSFKEIRELEQLPGLIEQLEARQAELNSKINSPEFYKQSADAVAAALAELKTTGEALAQAYLRWDALDGLQ